MMSILWTDVFPSLIEQDQYMEARGHEPPTLVVNADQITAHMRVRFSPDSGSERVPGVPLRAWVSQALGLLCKLRYARRMGTDYEVRYRTVRKPLDTFIRRVCDLALREEQKRLEAVGGTPSGTLAGFD